MAPLFTSPPTYHCWSPTGSILNLGVFTKGILLLSYISPSTWGLPTKGEKSLSLPRTSSLMWNNWFERILDAQAEFRLVLAKASKRLGSDQLESSNGHNHAERESNIESVMKVI